MFLRMRSEMMQAAARSMMRCLPLCAAAHLIAEGSIILPDRANIIEKRTPKRAFFWWGMVDSNHRRHRQQIYSLSPLATREIPHIKLELVDGFEPPTC